jgi:CDP-glycerol glycerophosphotransferase (TagB/SpsB family)
MKKGLKSSKHLLLWCSPGFGVIDIWLPIIKKLKERSDVKIFFVFPEQSSLQLENENSSLFNLAEEFADKIIYRGYSGRFFLAPTLVNARSKNKLSNFDTKIVYFANRLVNGSMSKYLILKLTGKCLLEVFQYITHVKEFIKNQKLCDTSLLTNVDGILCDITKENKSVNDELKNELKDIPKFSMLHGLAATWLMNNFVCEHAVRKRSDVVVYNMSRFEIDGYKKCFGILEKNIIHAGIPRHDNDWIEFICSHSNSIKENAFDSYIFIIGRQTSPYNTPERKKKALKDIYNVVCKKHKLKLVVKTHPKEHIDGIDGHIYMDALGKENYGKTWIYSDNHPFILGKKAIFSISFYSGVILDMLAINKPTIEYLDMKDLEAYDNSNSLRDDEGNPVLNYRSAKLVLGASSKLELERHVESILNKYEATMLPLASMYEYCFEPLNGASKMVADDIYKKIND